jgi:hypothetical protein
MLLPRRTEDVLQVRLKSPRADFAILTRRYLPTRLPVYITSACASINLVRYGSQPMETHRDGVEYSSSKEQAATRREG